MSTRTAVRDPRGAPAREVIRFVGRERGLRARAGRGSTVTSLNVNAGTLVALRRMLFGRALALLRVAVAAAILTPGGALAAVTVTDAAVTSTVSTGTGATNVTIDGFAVVSTTNAQVNITSVTLTFGSTSTTAQEWLQAVRITQNADGSGTNYAVSFTASGNTITVTTTGLAAPKSGNPVQNAYVVIDIKPAPTGTAGGTTNLTAYVSSCTSFGSTGDAVGNSATVTVDNTAPANVTSVTGTPGTGQISVGWSHTGTDLGQVVIARQTGGAVSGAPAEGAIPAVNATLSDGSVVVYVGTTSPFVDSVPSGSYSYKLFAGDAWGNWASGIGAGPYSPSAPSNSTQLGTGSDPVAATICPAGTAYVDQLTFTVTGNNDTVNGLTVPLTGAVGVGAAIQQLELRSSSGASLAPQRFATISGDTATFSGAALPANVGTTTYTLYATAKDHAGFSGSPTLSAKVQTFTGLGANTTGGSDSASTFTLDNAAPAAPTWGTNTAGDGQVVLNWTNPGSDFAQAVIVRKELSAPTGVPTEGQLTYAVNDPIGDGTVVYFPAPATVTFTDATALNGHTYYYGLYARDACGNWSAVRPTAAALSPNIAVPGAPGNPTFSSTTQTSTTLTWTNATGAASYKVERSPDPPGAYTQVATNVQPGASTTSWTDNTGLAANTKYWYRVRGANAGGDGPYNATPATVTTLINPPSTPGTFTFSTPTQNAVNISWVASTGTLSGYKLERAQDNGANAPGQWAQVYAPATNSQPDSNLTPGIKYWYRVRAWNTGGDSAYNTPQSVTMLPATTALGDGTNPANPAAPLCPSGVATYLDAFTLSSTGAPDTVTSVTVKLSPSGASSNVGSVEIADSLDAVKGSAVPNGDTVTVSVGAGIASPVGSSTAYKVRIVPKPHTGATAAPAPYAGQSYATTALVTAIQGQNPNPTLGDAAPASGYGTVTVDNASPANPKWGTVTVTGTPTSTAALAWTAPASADVARVLVLKNSVPVQDAPTEGQPHASGTVGTSTISYSAAATPGGAGSTSVTLAAGPTYFKIFAQDACGNWSTGLDLGPLSPVGALAEGDPTANTTKATLSIINPDRGSSVVGSFKVQVRVFYPTGIPTNDLTLSIDGGSSVVNGIAFTKSSKYDGANDRGVFETTVSSSNGLASGQTYTLRVKSLASGVLSNAVPIRYTSGTAPGSGELLVRDNSSQLCTDCHAMLPHSSETSGGKHGAWATTCRDCHTAHGTTNTFLVRSQVTPPAVNGYQGPKDVRFSKQTGYTATGGASTPAQASYANADGTGPCQACHTRTKSPDGQARYQTGGGAGDGHYADEKCTKCHGHQSGFDADQGGQCKSCHLKPQTDTDDYLWNGTPAIVNETEWNTYGHGATAASLAGSGGKYLSGNGPAQFSAQGNGAGDVGCLYCHLSSGKHGDLKNYFRLANTKIAAFGPNGTCLVCHDKKNGTTYDPDGPASSGGIYYAALGSVVRVPAGHDGHPSVDDTGGSFCWDCHDPHGEPGGATSWYMLQTKLVQSSIAAGPSAPTTYADSWGIPNAAAGTKEFATITGFSAGLGGDTTQIDYADYYTGGLCRNCHDTENTTAGTGVKFYNKTVNVGYGTASTNHPVSPTDDTVRMRCTDCHIHKIGCGGCHTAPPASGVHSSHNQIPAADQLDVDYRKTTPETTEALYGLRCAKCHNGTHNNQVADATRGSSTNPYTAELMWDATTDPKTTAASPNNATYTSGATQAVGSPYLGGESNPTKYWGWSEGTCRTQYCHSNGAPADNTATYKDLVWKTGGGQPAWNCTSCHGDSVTATATMSKAHALHFSTGYAYGCQKCHLSVATSATALNTAYTGGGKKLHVNGLKDVKFDASFGQGAGTYDGTGRTCSNTYCHSNGTVRGATSYTNGPSVAWTSTGASTCAYCHGGDATAGTNVIGGAPPPTGKGGTAAHTKHVNNASVIGVNVGCASCHSATVSSNTAISGRTNHVNGDPNVSLASITRPSGGTARSGGTPTGTSPATACNSNWCHSTGQETLTATPVTWTTTWSNSAPQPVCKGCHGASTTNPYVSLAGEPDWTGTGNRHNAKHIPQTSGTAAAAACVRCHQTTVTTAGTAILATTPSLHLNGDRDVSFANVGTNPGGGATPYNATKQCQAYCHSNATPLGGSATYATVAWDQTTAVGCTSCHGGKDTNTATMSASHAKHVNSTTGTYAYSCYQCHWGTTQADGVILSTSTKHVDGVKTDASFNPAYPGWAPQSTATYNASTHQCSNTYCHGAFAGGVGNVAVTWNTTVTCGTSCHGTPPTDTTHQSVAQGANCGGCHSETGYSATTVNYTAHANGVKTGGGGCLGCHGGAQKANRRAVNADFALQSHHVRTGGAKGAVSYLSDHDCVICHAEGSAASQTTDPTTNDYNATTNPTGTHYNQKIDLRDADTGAVYVFDKDAIATAAGAAANWGSQSQRWREETSGVSEVTSFGTTAHGLDKFCLSCHDSNGASAAYLQGDSGATAQNPFYDDALKNNYDTLTRPTITDIKSKVSALGQTDADADGINDPPKGLYARHAIRGQSLSVYKTYSTGVTLYTGSATSGATMTAPTLIPNVQEVIKIPGTTTNAYSTPAATTPLWSDRSVMGCADCHTVDGGNQPANLNAPSGIYGNAHGSASEYMLKDGGGGAAEGSYAGLNYVCYRCHKVGWYVDGKHTPNAADWGADSTACNITNRVSSACAGGLKGSNWTGSACGTCHGGFEWTGVYSPTGTGFKGYGSIHGNSASVPTNSTNSGVDCEANFNATTCHRAYRFMNGASMRYYNPQDWNLAPQNCVTLTARTSDTWGACSQHDGTGYSRSRPVPRALRY